MTGKDILDAFHRGSVSIKINNASAEELNKLQNILGVKLGGKVDLIDFCFEKDTDYYICNTMSLEDCADEELIVCWRPFGKYEFTMERFFSFFDDKKIHKDDFLEVFQ